MEENILGKDIRKERHLRRGFNLLKSEHIYSILTVIPDSSIDKTLGRLIKRTHERGYLEGKLSWIEGLNLQNPT